MSCYNFDMDETQNFVGQEATIEACRIGRRLGELSKILLESQRTQEELDAVAMELRESYLNLASAAHDISNAPLGDWPKS